MRFHLLAATILAGGLFVPALAVGQEATGTGTATPTATEMQQADMEFANKAAAAGKAEVELAQVGTEKATNPDVKTFAGRLVEDHTKANEQLTQIMQDKGMEMPAEAPAEAKAEYDRIAALSGNEFDREFMMHWVSSHEKGIELYSTEAESGQDPELKQFAADTLPTLQEHLDEAKRIESSLEQVAGSETPEQQSQPAAGTAAEQAAGTSATDSSGESAEEQPSTGTTATGGTTQQGREQLDTAEGTTGESTAEQPAAPDTTTAEGTAGESTTEQPAAPDTTTAEGTAEQPATGTGTATEEPTATQEAARPTYPLGDKTANDLIGQTVVNQNGDNVGEIYDIVLNSSDQAVLAVVSVGGFLGIGEKNVAVPFEQLQPSDTETILMSTATEDELKAMPEYVEGEGYTAVPRDRPIGDGAM